MRVLEVDDSTKINPVYVMCSQMSGFCYDSAKDIAV